MRFEDISVLSGIGDAQGKDRRRDPNRQTPICAGSITWAAGDSTQTHASRTDKRWLPKYLDLDRSPRKKEL